jgi:predicted site-specific integrase-resolvase
MTQQNHFSLKEVAKIVGVKAHRIEYALRNGYLSEPAERVTNRRIFTTADLQAALMYFAKPTTVGRPVSTEGDR